MRKCVVFGKPYRKRHYIRQGIKKRTKGIIGGNSVLCLIRSDTFKFSDTTGIASMIRIRSVFGMGMFGASAIANRHIMLQAKDFPVVVVRKDRSSQHNHADHHQYPCYVSSPFHR